MTVKNQPQRVWEKEGWELWTTKQGNYTEVYIKRLQKDFRIHSARIGEHGIQVRFKRSTPRK